MFFLFLCYFITCRTGAVRQVPYRTGAVRQVPFRTASVRQGAKLAISSNWPIILRFSIKIILFPKKTRLASGPRPMGGPDAKELELVLVHDYFCFHIFNKTNGNDQ
jgi:hypothetical protein